MEKAGCLMKGKLRMVERDEEYAGRGECRITRPDLNSSYFKNRVDPKVERIK